MAEFKLAYARTSLAEGDYSNLLEDRGGETWRGISRRAHPEWSGWAIIDATRNDPQFPKNLAAIPELQTLVEELYEAEYWTPLTCDSLPQPLADRLFDVAVHMGLRRAAIFLQVGLNVLNRDGKLWRELTIDGQLGAASQIALTKAMEHAESDRLAECVRFQAAARHIEIALTNPTQRAFIRGWLARDAA